MRFNYIFLYIYIYNFIKKKIGLSVILFNYFHEKKFIFKRKTYQTCLSNLFIMFKVNKLTTNIYQAITYNFLCSLCRLKLTYDLFSSNCRRVECAIDLREKNDYIWNLKQSSFMLYSMKRDVQKKKKWQHLLSLISVWHTTVFFRWTLVNEE